MSKRLSRVAKKIFLAGVALAALALGAAGGEQGGAPRKPLALVLITAEDEYRTHETLPKFAAKHLGKEFAVRQVVADPKDPNNLPGMEALDKANVVVLSVRRRAPTKAQLAALRKYIADGKPLVALRTSSHAFTLLKGKPLPEGHEQWVEFDRDVLGGNYTGHHGNRGKATRTLVRTAAAAAKHPILDGLPADEFAVTSWLYRTSPLSKEATVLLTGRAPGVPMSEPVAWTHTSPGGGRVFYTSLGHPDDFRVPAFRRLLRNGIYWTSGLPVPRTDG
jgi:type 1 glutamine amidotransferase